MKLLHYVRRHDDLLVNTFHILSWIILVGFLIAFALTGYLMFWVAALVGFVICRVIVFLSLSIAFY